MARTPRDVTEAELGVLQVLWQRGPSTVREVAEASGDIPTAGRLAGVQTLLGRLERKGFVHRANGDGGPQRFVATVGREELIGQRLRGIAEELCEGSLTPLLTHLVRQQALSPEELRSLRELIDRSDERTGRR